MDDRYEHLAKLFSRSLPKTTTSEILKMRARGEITSLECIDLLIAADRPGDELLFAHYDEPEVT